MSYGRVRGVEGFRELARDLRAADKHLMRELRAEFKKAAEPLDEAVGAEIREVMPTRGGYAGVLEGAYRQTVSVRGSGARAGLSVVGYARGKKEYRDLPRLDQGVLRHPIYGRYRRTKHGGRKRNPWTAQAIRRGVWSRPAERLLDRVVAGAEAAIDRVRDRLARG